MKRYLLFASENDGRETGGGWDDYRGDFDSLDEVYKTLASAPAHDWYQVVDGHTAEVIDDGRPRAHGPAGRAAKQPKRNDPAKRPPSTAVKFTAGGRVPLKGERLPD